MDRLRKLRRQPRRVVTLTISEVDAELANENPDEVLLAAKKQKLDENRDLLMNLDQQISDAMLDANCSEEDLDAEIDTVQEYREKIRIAIIKIDAQLKESTESIGSYHSVRSRVRNGHDDRNGQRNFKLPKIELQKFTGDLKDWLGFWSQFQKIDEDVSLHSSDKFQYLLQAMESGTEAWEVVHSYPATEANYPLAVEALKNRFGRESLLLQVYIRELLQLVIVNVTQKDKLPLERMYLKLESHLRALSSLNLATADPATWLFPLVESSLPVDILRAWQRSSLSKRDGNDENPQKTCLDHLMEFLKGEVQSEQQIALAQSGFQNGYERPKANKKKYPVKSDSKLQDEEHATVAGLYVGEKANCLFCDKAHDSDKCGKAHSMTLDEKIREIRKRKGCFVCLRSGHWSKSCRAFIKCAVCGKKHNVIMCPELPRHQKSKGTEKKSIPDESSQKVNANFSGSSKILLATFRATLVNGNSKLEVRGLYDPGAQRSYVTEEVTKKLQLIPVSEEKVSHSLFGGVQTETQVLKAFKLQIINRIGEGISQISVLEKKKLCGDIPHLPPGPWLKKLKKNKVWISDMSSGGDNEIDLLVGADFYGKMLTGRVLQVDKGLTAIETILGWVVTGAVDSGTENNVAMTIINMFCAENISLEKLWSLEAIGIRDQGEHRTKVEREAATKKHFLETVTRKPDGRYCVRLPWVDGAQKIPPNKRIAQARLLTATTKLNTANMYAQYDSIFNSWEQEGIVEFLTEQEEEQMNCHYLPHRPVFKPTSLTTPVRPVFDASCKKGRNPSLNDCCEKGPNLLELIPSVLHRFREKRVGVLSDIRKAFQMIDVQEEDRNYLRFLWWESPETKTLKIIRHCRVVFGVNCSPFLLAAVLEYHLCSIQDSRQEIAQKLLRGLYVDNCVTSVDSIEEYEDFRLVSTELLAEAKMELRQWEFTVGEEPGVGSLISRECGLGSSNGEFPQELTNVLGYKWNKWTDTIRCDVPEKTERLPDKLTKRIVLSKVQKIFDPLGMLCPAMLPPKIILQKAWEVTRKPRSNNTGVEKHKRDKEETTWDTELPEILQQKFRNWYRETEELQNVAVPRSIRRNFKNEEIHVFSDASTHAYATVIFLRVESEEGISVQFMQAKCRVAPLKKLSIPRLELMACTISARLLTSIRDSIDIQNAPVYFWSDSSTALAWIKRNDEWGTFVGNRVKEILKLTNVDSWRHIPGIYNPADLPSRGCTAKELVSYKWWQGPEWLNKPHREWPNEDEWIDEEAVSQERRKTAVMLNTISTVVPWYLKIFPRYSSNLRVFAWVLRFWDRMQKKRYTTGPLTPEELHRAERRMVGLVQKEAFPDREKLTVIGGVKIEKSDDGLLVVKTKLQNRSDAPAFKSPSLLPKDHPFVEQLLREVHTMNRHAGAQYLLGKLREKFWILQGRKTVKKMISKCIPCRRFMTKAPVVPEAALPEDRVKEARIFQIVGVDLAGPLFLLKGTKAWIVLFTCAIYRGIHLEMVTSLSTDAFLLALHRFISRRGRPEKIYSDNGTNFVGANNLFLSLDWKRIERDTRLHRIQWRFNPPAAAWWGGFFERLIRSIKDLLRKSLGHKKLNEAQLETCLCEVEAIINGRPLTYVTEDSEDLIPLTPAMFMQDIQTCDFPEEECLQAGDLVKRFKSLSKLKEDLRSRFRTEYLALLVHRGKTKKPTEFRVGDVVLMGSDNKKRHEWPLAIVVELVPGHDGHHRVAKVRTSTGMLLRPLQRLFPLEVTQPQMLPDALDKIKLKLNECKVKGDDEQKEVKESDDELKEVKRTRYGRVVKPVVFFENQ